LRVARVIYRHDFIRDRNLTPIASEAARQDLHKGGFASPVFANQGVDLSPLSGKVYSAQHRRPAVMFDDASHLKKFGRHDPPLNYCPGNWKIVS
jgi:hypothetical protein